MRTALLRSLILIVATIAAGCGPEDAVAKLRSGITVEALEVNQVMGVLAAPKFVAGKNTVILAHLSEATAVDAANQKLVVNRDGKDIVTLEPSPAAEPTKALSFVCPTRDACEGWAAGTYSFTATINGETKTAAATFVPRRTIRILAVPLKAKYGSEIRTVDEKWKKGGEFMRSVWPVSLEGFKWTLREELDVSQHDVTTEEGRKGVWEALKNLNPSRCETAPTAEGCYDAVSGFIKTQIQMPGGGGLQGYTYGAPAVVNVNDDEDMPATVAHEVAHMAPYSLGDEYKGGSFRCEVNPPPPAYKGSEWSSDKKDVSCGSSSEVEYGSDGRTGDGSLIPEAAHSFEVGGRGLLKEMVSFMGSGAKQSQNWVTQRMYDKLFDAASPMQNMDSPITGPVLELAGWIKKDSGAPSGYSVELEPWWGYSGALPHASTSTAGFAVVALDSAGKELARTHLDVSFVMHSNPPREVDSAPLDGAIAFPAGTARFEVRRDATVLATVPVTPAKPVVHVTAPAAKSTVHGQATITWTGSDADGDKLHYAVEYCASSHHCEVLASDVTETSLKDNFDDLPGSKQAFVRVTATDGANTTVAESEKFTVPDKAPQVVIFEPEESFEVKAGQEVTLEGEAYDEQDGQLTSSQQLTWSSSLDGDLGGGPLLYTHTLQVGTHEITLTATNAEGLTAKASVSITVTPGDAKKGGGCSAGLAPGPNVPDGAFALLALLALGVLAALHATRRRA